MKAMPSDLELELDDGAWRVKKLLEQAHKDTESVEKIRILWEADDSIVLEKDQLTTIFEQIGAFPNVKEIVILFRQTSFPLPVRALQRLIYCHEEAIGAAEMASTAAAAAAAAVVVEEEEISTPTSSSTTTATRHLGYLHLFRVELSGTMEEFEAFRETLERNRSIKKVNLHTCKSTVLLRTTDDLDSNNVSNNVIQGDEINQTLESTLEEIHGVNSLLLGLSKIPSLSTLHLDNIQHLTSTAMLDICRSPHLKLLELWNMEDVINQHGPAVASLLAQNQTGLQELEISSSLQRMAGQAFINMLHTNTTLTTLGLDIDYSRGFGDALASVLFLKHNTTLTTLRLRLVGKEPIVVRDDDDDDDGENNNDDESTNVASSNSDDNNGESSTTTTTTTTPESQALSSVYAIVKAMETNTSLEHLHMNLYHVEKEAVEALDRPFAELLDINFVLKYLSLRGNHRFATLGSDVDFKLRLNRAGRHHLLLGDKGAAAPRLDWVKAILEHQDELSFVFYFISVNPSLCNNS